MKLSPAELSYIKTSLGSNPPNRPDSRQVGQFRPLEATTNFLPTANGSARVRTSDGGECIVGVKAQVVNHSQCDKLVDVDVDIAGVRDDHPMPNVLSSTFISSLESHLASRLRLTTRFSFKLSIDGLILSHSSHPLGLLSLTIYLALMSTRLPQIISSTDDSTAEEIPVFNDDWDQAIPLCNDGFKPPLLLLLAVCGENVLVDPSEEEEAVSEAGMIISWCDGKVVAPIRMVDLTGSRSKGLKTNVMMSGYKLITECAPEIAEALDLILAMDKDHDELTTTLY